MANKRHLLALISWRWALAGFDVANKALDFGMQVAI
jgi:hypothetical protein